MLIRLQPATTYAADDWASGFGFSVREMLMSGDLKWSRLTELEGKRGWDSANANPASETKSSKPERVS
jgi:hypothetical protein